MIELSPLAPAFLFLAFSEIVFGSYVLWKGRLSPVNRLFFNLALLAGIGSVFDLLVASPVTETQAVWAFRLLVFLLILEMGVALRLSAMIPHPIPMIGYGYNQRLYWLSMLGISTLAALSVGGMVNDEFGWVPASDIPFALIMLLLVLYLTFMAMMFARRWKGLKGLARRQAVILTAALVIPATLMIAIMFMETAGAKVPRIYGLGELVSLAILAYGILRYNLMEPPRVVELAASSRPMSSLVKGRAYLFEQASPDRMFDSVVHEMAGGMSTLIIARTHPDQLRAKYQLTQTPILWLAQTPGPDRIDPANIQLLTHMTMGFVDKGPSVIALEGLEYLLVNNDLNRVMKFLGQLRDEVIVEGSILLVSVDPRAMTERQRAILERELEVMKE